ncbi:polysaccharide deacetylase family protein [Mobilicoccus massiliensis]|uniref:polysaccharide deacetylase family protein n=1 Tax=Mobilicoccus massiliensis TaxID=1522310 RepID=UPI0009E44FAD|nr:polysaccharide deacetylase family protein [Mobilicoccus massiliensis]
MSSARRIAVTISALVTATATTIAPAVGATPASATPASATTAAAAPTASKPRPAKKRAAPKVAYLTFDDGPTATYTPQVLAVLDRYDAKATFFMIGRQAAARPELVEQVRQRGHVIGNHTWDHPNLVPLPAAEISAQVTRTNATVQRMTGRRVTCLRPPGGGTSPRVQKLAHRHRLEVVLWNVDTRDWTRPGAAAIQRAATANPHGGGPRLILMHDGGGDRSQSVAALPGVLSTLKKQGYRFETLPACR